MDEKKEIRRLIVEYEDGTTKEIEKGFTARVDNNNVSFDMVNMENSDLSILCLSVLEMGDKLGIFEGLEDVE